MNGTRAAKDLALLAVQDGVAKISINREEKRNALSLATIDQILSCLIRAEQDPAVRVVVLTGVGSRAFAAGADLDELPGVFATAESARLYDDRVARLYRAMEGSRLPIVARMAGAAIGGGCLLALACDLRVAASNVKVGFPVARIGLMLSPYEYRLILDYLPLSLAKRLLFTGQMLVGAEAASFGLLDYVVAGETLDQMVDEVAQTVARGAPLAIAASKRISNAIVRGRDLEQAIADSYAAVYPSRDLSEGLKAIEEKRTPTFVGA